MHGLISLVLIDTCIPVMCLYNTAGFRMNETQQLGLIIPVHMPNALRAPSPPL